MVESNGMGLHARLRSQRSTTRGATHVAQSPAGSVRGSTMKMTLGRGSADAETPASVRAAMTAVSKWRMGLIGSFLVRLS